MKKALLIRNQSTDAGTFGVFTLYDDQQHILFKCTSGELPDRGNEPGLSSIPVGTYIASPFHSPRHGDCYMLRNVPGRTDVEIHIANRMGDVKKGYMSELLGCIALGMSIGTLPNDLMPQGQTSLINSHVAFDEFMNAMNGDDLELSIINGGSAS